MPVIFVATTNPGKLEEYRHLFKSIPGARVVSPGDVEIWVEVAETGETLTDNALLKARALREALPPQAVEEGWWVLGDDSGLEIDALNGAPGVHSNRWAGPGTTAEQRNVMILDRLRDVPDSRRAARFRCVIALIAPDGTEHIVEGAVEGNIAHEPRGSGGFGYDPVFELPGSRRMAELSPDEKNRISHRGVAGEKAAAVIKAEQAGRKEG